MKKRSRSHKARFVLKMGRGGSSYDIEPIYRLETMLAKKPRYLQLDLVGARELSADCKGVRPLHCPFAESSMCPQNRQ